MNENSTQIINNYNIEASSLINMIAAQEQTKIINAFRDSNVIVELDGKLVAVAYDNWDEREQEGHEPKISLKQVG